MTLIPTGGIVGAIAKLEAESPSAARALVQLALFESLSDQVDDLRPTLAPMVYEAVEDVTKAARTRLLRFGVSKADDDQLDVAEGLSVIDKALFGSEKAKFEQARRRDARGRFVRTNFTGPDPTVARANPKLSQTTRSNEARGEVKRLMQAGLITEKTPISLFTQRRDEKGRPGTEHGDPIVATPAELDTIIEALPEDIELAGMSVRRSDLERMNPKQQAALDLVGLFSGQDLAGSKHILNRMPLDDQGKVKDATQTASSWNGPSRGGSEQDRQAYRRLKLTGQALQSVSAPGSTANIAGGMAELISDLGPEAEKVLGPGLRRAAYRYRGTERRPDKVARDTIAESLRAVNGTGNEGDRPSDNPGAAIGRQYRGRGSRDQRHMASAGDAAAAYFLGLPGNPSLIPDRELAAVSAESGEIPPSQGVIIDHEGRIVSQAVGFNGDHYLPFDLRNLSALKGGQYVRTRTVGGPTTEDIYTGLLTGARQVQVVSNSGVFTLEFDPTLRGGRRYSDKARRMVSRYQQMLEAIAKPDSTLYERDLSPKQMAEIRRGASEAADSEQEYQQLVERGIAQARVKGGMGSEDDDNEQYEAAEHRARTRMEAEVDPREHSPRQISRMFEDYVAEEMQNAGDGGVRKLRLDGAGYDRAMRALQQEFPVFIRRAEWKALPDWIRERGVRNPGFGRVGANDRGYVQPGQTNPELGLHGANSRRRVAGARATAAAAVEAPKEAATTSEGGAKPTAATSSTRPSTKPIREQLMAPSSPFRNKVVRDAAEMVIAMAATPPSSSPVQEGTDPLSYGPYAFLNHKMTEIQRTSRGNEGRTFVDWFLGANEQERSMALAGMDQAHDNFAYWESGDRFDTTVKPAIAGFKQALTLLEPFAPAPKEGDWMLTEPAEHDARPFKVDNGIPEVGASDADFDKARARLEFGNERMTEAMADFEGASNQQRSETMRDLVAEVAEAESAGLTNAKTLRTALAAHWTAWAFHHSREVTAEVRKIMGGGAGPKAPGVEKAARRRVIVHKLDDPFSRRMRAELGIPEPSSASA